MIKYFKFSIGIFLLFCVFACYDADNFYADLTKMPQINTDQNFAYKSFYFVGDTMTVNGKLNSEHNLEIRIGAVKANIFSVKKIKYTTGTSDNGEPITNYMEQASFVITKDMLGEQKSVSVKSADQRTYGPSVDIIPSHDPKGFNSPLTISDIATLPNDILLINCINGKGDIYYFDVATESIIHYNKTGVKEILISKDKPIMLNGQPYNYAELTAGAVTPDGSYLYLFVKSTGLIEVELSSRNAVVMNNKTDMKQGPYEGNIADVPLVIGSMRADNDHNLYLEINDTDAYKKGLAFYEKATGKVNYVINNNTGLPGLTTSYVSYHFSPEDHFVYLEGSQFSPYVRDILLVDLKTRTVIESLVPQTGAQNKVLFGRFSTMKTELNSASPDTTFGYLPEPGKRLVYLAWQMPFSGPEDRLPQWVVLDFNAQMSLPLGLGKFDVQNSIFQPTNFMKPRIDNPDKILNYDEEGNIYFTVNGKQSIARTKPTKI